MLALALFFLLSTYAIPEQPPIHGHCIGISDGDTIRVLSGDNQQIRVRLAFIDAPELGQAFGQRAKQAMSDLVFGKDVKLRPHTIDRYGRLVAVVYVGDTDAGFELLKQGLCWVYEKLERVKGVSRLPRVLKRRETSKICSPKKRRETFFASHEVLSRPPH